MNHVISWSGGKDSTATVILFHEHEKELINEGDRVIILFSELMFDLKNNISGHNPEIISFIYDTKPIFESWGYEVHVLRSDIDYLTYFHGKMKGSPDPNRNGLTRGFPLAAGLCWAKRELKNKPRTKFLKTLKDGFIEYVGLAADEPERLIKLQREKPNARSILIEYGYTEADAKKLCEDNNMLSPQYLLLAGTQKRDGCWFCPYAKLVEHEMIRDWKPEVWEQYVALEDTPNMGNPKWFVHAKETLHEQEEFFKSQDQASA